MTFYHPSPLPGCWTVVLYTNDGATVHPVKHDPLTDFYYWVGFSSQVSPRVNGIALWVGSIVSMKWERPT